MRNLLILENTSVKALAQMIESGTLILDDKQVKWLIQDWTQVQTFSYLKAQTLQALHIEHYFQNPKYLVELAQGALSDSDLFQMISEFIEQNKTSLRPYYFNEHGTLLSFLSPSDYEPLALKWLEQHYKNKDFDIPFEIFHLAHNRHLKSLIKQRRSIDIRHVNIQQVDKEVASYCMNSDSALFVYQCLPQALQDDMDLALIVCGRNKQDYLKLSLNAQCHLRVLCYATNDFIAPYSDGDTYHIDKSALSLNKVPLEVVLHIEPTASACYYMAKIFKSQKTLVKNQDVQAKWFHVPEFEEYFKQIFSCLDMAQQNAILPRLIQLSSDKLDDFIENNNAKNIKRLIGALDKSKIFELLTHQLWDDKANFDKILKKFGLNQNWLNTHLQAFLSTFIQLTPEHCEMGKVVMWQWLHEKSYPFEAQSVLDSISQKRTILKTVQKNKILNNTILEKFILELDNSLEKDVKSHKKPKF